MPPIPVRPSELKNKDKRADLYKKQKLEKQKQKAEKRKQRAKEEEKNPELKEKRLRENVPRTIENTREKDDTMVPDDGEVAEDEALDELSSYFSGKTPKICITTSKKCSQNCYDFCADLVSIFPNTTFAKRAANHEMKDMIQQAIKHDFTDLMIVNEDKKTPNAITLIHLPDGPTAYFKLSSYTPAKKTPGKGVVTAHNPELILNNFNTRLGHTIGRMFQALVPQVPEFEGRQVVTFHNQRDFIFVRRHRYVFRDTEKVGLKELGPRFTLKLRWLQKGTYSRDGEYEWMFRPDMEVNRKRFYL